jgi:hypothetical protein
VVPEALLAVAVDAAVMATAQEIPVAQVAMAQCE